MLYRVPIVEVNQRDGTSTSDPALIQQSFHDKWSSIMCENDFRPPTRAARRQFLRALRTCLTEEQRTDLDSPITCDEMAEAIMTMLPKKTPGLDGFSTGFYQIDPKLFGEILRRVFVINLNEENYWAFNDDPPFLFYSKEATEKILATIDRYTDPCRSEDSPSRFVKGRRIHDHIIFLRDLQHKHILDDEEGYSMFLGFEKAYDRINWDYMMDTLEAFNFGRQFLKWVRLLYNQPIAHVIINGALSEAFRPTRGVKQGDPLSSLLFALSVEPLSQLLRDHEELGIPFSETRIATTLLFADDTTLLASSSENLERQLDLVEELCGFSGVKRNRHDFKSSPEHSTPLKAENGCVWRSHSLPWHSSESSTGSSTPTQ
ncbi:hypothetical protein LEN26_005361 [Aphanomyces euteiches]|nr:hypothetical protein AeMF1_014163 [Aphanomyces euteiches]KAH9138291.1 hypothetical protein LEN26_005361 [Aphanomyces euteiches]KAH9189226.1 hypothetical protein AeNC1_008798 [Aphanomyces euteiches]